MTNTYYCVGAATAGELWIANLAGDLAAGIIGESYPEREPDRLPARQAYITQAVAEVRIGLRERGLAQPMILIEPARPGRSWRPVTGHGLVVLRWRTPSGFLVSLEQLGWLDSCGIMENSSQVGKPLGPGN